MVAASAFVMSDSRMDLTRLPELRRNGTDKVIRPSRTEKDLIHAERFSHLVFLPTGHQHWTSGLV